jgi:hypothetical protein
MIDTATRLTTTTATTTAACCLAVPLLLIRSSRDENGPLITSTGHPAYENHQFNPNHSIKGSVRGDPHVDANELNSVLSTSIQISLQFLILSCSIYSCALVQTCQHIHTNIHTIHTHNHSRSLAYVYISLYVRVLFARAITYSHQMRAHAFDLWYCTCIHALVLDPLSYPIALAFTHIVFVFAILCASFHSWWMQLGAMPLIQNDKLYCCPHCSRHAFNVYLPFTSQQHHHHHHPVDT